MYQRPQTVNAEALAYCFSAIVSMLDISVIQNQHATIYAIVAKQMLADNVESPQVAKYGLIALQFLLHSKTEPEWNNAQDMETQEAFVLMLQSLVDRREKVQKQAQKSLCIIFQNKKIERLYRTLGSFQAFVTEVFNQQLSL